MPHPTKKDRLVPGSATSHAALKVVLIYAVFAAAWILFSDKAVSLLFKDPAQIATVSTLKGWLFVAVTSLLLLDQLRRFAHRMSAPGGEADRSRSGFGQDGTAAHAADPEEEGAAGKSIRTHFLPLSLLAVAIVVAGVGGIIYTAHQQREKEVARLQAIADLKAAQVSTWLEERYMDARALRLDDPVTDLYRRWRGAHDENSRGRLLQRLEGYRRTYSYRSIALLDARGKLVLAVGESHRVAPQLRATARRAVAGGEVLTTGLYRSDDRQGTRISLDFVVPFAGDRDRPGLALALQVDPRNFLYPYIQSWPLPSATAETLLFRREGDHVLFLNELRHRPNTALRLRVSLARSELLSVQAALDRTKLGKVIEGIDYRRVPVVGVVKAIPGADWFLVAKLDRDELYAPAKRDALWIVLVDSLALLAAAGAVMLFRQHRELQLFQLRRREQEEKLRALRLLDAIAEGSTDAIFAKDGAGRYLLLNREASRVTNKPREEVLGRDDRMLFPPAEAEMIMAGDRQVMAGDRVRTCEEVLTTAAGVATFLTTKGPLHDSAGNVIGLFGITRDITERKRVEEEKEITIEFLHLVNESRSSGELIRGAATFFQRRSGCEAVGIRLRDGDDYPYYEARGFPSEFVQAENSLCLRDEAGCAIRDSAGDPVLECMCGNVLRSRFDPAKPFFTARGSFWTNCTTELLATTSEADRQARTRNRCNGEGYESVALIALRSGEERLGLLQLNDRRTGLFSLASIQMWERLADYLAVALAKFLTDEALRESEERYRSLFENMQEGFAYCRMLYDDLNRPADFVYLDVNGAFERLTGLQDVVGRRVSEVLPGIRELSPELFEIYGRVASTGIPEKFEFDFKSLAQWLSISVYSPARGYFVAVFDDITERKRAEEERAKLEAQLRQAQKMEAIGRLAGGVAHDFNNMLNVILGYADMALMRLDPQDPLQKYIREIQKAGQRSAELTRQLLAFSRKQVTAPVVLNLNEVIADQQRMIGRMIGEDVRIEFMPAGELWNIRMDRSQLDQVLANLAVNARDAIAGVGTVTIETSNVTLDGGSSQSDASVSAGEYVLLAFSDTGCGMDAETQERIFEPFFTTKGEGKGTGLGLSTVYGIVRQNEGAIHVYSEPGMGTTFKIYLPRHQGEAAEPGEKPREHSPAGTETVLIVEDERQILELARAILAQNGYHVLVAATPAEACLACERYGGDIQLLLSDVVMPMMNGKELRERIEGIKPGIRTLFMSGYTADVIAHHGVIDQGVNFIQKPFTAQALAEKVRAVLDG